MANSGTSGNPAKRPAKKKTSWQKKSGEELLLPSGNTALVKRPGPDALLRKGVLPDAMGKMVSDMIATGQGMKKADVQNLSADPEALAGMLDAMDKVLCAVVISPKVRYHKGVKTDQLDSDGHPIYRDPEPGEESVIIPDEDRTDDIYSDDVEFDDKSFIFSFAVGGTRDLARFRRETGVFMGDVFDVEGDEQSSK